MTDGKKTIQVTEEEFEYLIKLRQELQDREAVETPREVRPIGVVRKDPRRRPPR